MVAVESRWKIRGREISPADFFGPDNLKKYSETILNILIQRGIDSDKKLESFFNFDYENDILNPFDFPEMGKAVKRLETALEKEEQVAVFGDYDADGVTSTNLLLEVLEDLGFKKPLYYIPDRQTEGYGMNKEAIDYLLQKGAQVIVTVDCGISNKDEVEYAKKQGLDVIITDHHQIPSEIPEALAVINPQMKKDYKFLELAGVGVAFKLSQALYKEIAPGKIDQLKWALDLVAIGTIADCVDLLGENRVLVKYGLIVLEKTKRTGLKELFKVGRINISQDEMADTQKVAFGIAPRINASGRMDHASVALELLQERDAVKARLLALEVEEKNKDRQKITEEIFKQVSKIAEDDFEDKKFIIAGSPHWPVGLLGLVAGKISDKFNKPTLVLQEKIGADWVGSLRSVPGVDIMEVLRKSKSFLSKFGGHSQAAGISLDPKNRDDFVETFSKELEDKLRNYKTSNIIEINCEIDFEDIGWELVKDVKKMEPFGEGNKNPIFLLRNVLVQDMKILGNGKKHLKIWVGKEGSSKTFEAIGFGMGDDWSHLKKNDKIDIVFNLEEDSWNGQKKIQLRLIDLKEN